MGLHEVRNARCGLKIDIGRTTVANILVETGLERAPERTRKRTWKHFMRSHWETLYACDFFAVESLGVFGTVRYMVFFVIELHSRAVRGWRWRASPGCRSDTWKRDDGYHRPESRRGVARIGRLRSSGRLWLLVH